MPGTADDSKRTAAASGGGESSDSDDGETDEELCPICTEPLDPLEKLFKPCKCGFQLCMFCFHHIKEDLNGACPICRTPYDPKNYVRLKPKQPAVSRRNKKSSNASLKQSKKQQALQNSQGGSSPASATSCITQQEMEIRKKLIDIRVVQRNLVYVTNIPLVLLKENQRGSEEASAILRRPEYFGQYGRIIKLVPNLNAVYNVNSPQGPTVSCYVTYVRKDDATSCLKAVNGAWLEGKLLRASYGTTKYCAAYLRGLPCTNPECLYLHEVGQERDSFTKETMAAGKNLFSDFVHPRISFALTGTTRTSYRSVLPPAAAVARTFPLSYEKALSVPPPAEPLPGGAGQGQWAETLTVVTTPGPVHTTFLTPAEKGIAVPSPSPGVQAAAAAAAAAPAQQAPVASALPANASWGGVRTLPSAGAAVAAAGATTTTTTTVAEPHVPVVLKSERASAVLTQSVPALCVVATASPLSKSQDTEPGPVVAPPLLAPKSEQQQKQNAAEYESSWQATTTSLLDLLLGSGAGGSAEDIDADSEAEPSVLPSTASLLSSEPSAEVVEEHKAKFRQLLPNVNISFCPQTASSPPTPTDPGSARVPAPYNPFIFVQHAQQQQPAPEPAPSQPVPQTLPEPSQDEKPVPSASEPVPAPARKVSSSRAPAHPGPRVTASSLHIVPPSARTDHAAAAAAAASAVSQNSAKENVVSAPPKPAEPARPEPQRPPPHPQQHPPKASQKSKTHAAAAAPAPLSLSPPLSERSSARSPSPTPTEKRAQAPRSPKPQQKPQVAQPPPHQPAKAQRSQQKQPKASQAPQSKSGRHSKSVSPEPVVEIEEPPPAPSKEELRRQQLLLAESERLQHASQESKGEDQNEEEGEDDGGDDLAVPTEKRSASPSPPRTSEEHAKTSVDVAIDKLRRRKQQKAEKRAAVGSAAATVASAAAALPAGAIADQTSQRKASPPVQVMESPFNIGEDWEPRSMIIPFSSCPGCGGTLLSGEGAGDKSPGKESVPHAAISLTPTTLICPLQFDKFDLLDDGRTVAELFASFKFIADIPPASCRCSGAPATTKAVAIPVADPQIIVASAPVVVAPAAAAVPGAGTVSLSASKEVETLEREMESVQREVQILESRLKEVQLRNSRLGLTTAGVLESLATSGPASGFVTLTSPMTVAEEAVKSTHTTTAHPNV